MHTDVISDTVHLPWIKGPKARNHDFRTEVYPLIQHIKSDLNITSVKCSEKEYPNIVIIKRKTKDRKIRNLKLLVKGLLERYVRDMGGPTASVALCLW